VKKRRSNFKKRNAGPPGVVAAAQQYARAYTARHQAQRYQRQHGNK
jgi:hypothetical protein